MDNQKVATQQDLTLQQLLKLAELEVEALEVIWLYGSRANATAEEASDYDLAIAFKDPVDNDLTKPFSSYSGRCEELAYQWSKRTGSEISIVDINKIPAPLAYSVITDGVVLYIQNTFRQLSEEQRIWSIWEEYKYQYEKYRA